MRASCQPPVSLSTSDSTPGWRYGSGRHLARERLTILPDVPTAKQAGLDYEVSIWAGMFAPKGTPTGIIDKLANNLDPALKEPAVKNRLANLGVSLPRMEERSPAKFASFVKSEISRWSPILKAANAESKSPCRAERSSGIGGKRQSAYQPGDLFGEFASFRTTSVAQCSSHVR